MTTDRIKAVFLALDKAVVQSGGDIRFLGEDASRSETIKLIEQALSVRLPGSYKTFLLRYGFGGSGALEVEGIGIDGSAAVIGRTIENRKENKKFHKGLVFLSYDDDWYYCLDTSRFNDNGECPAVEYDYVNDEIRDAAPDFLSLLIQQFELDISGKINFLLA